MIRQKYLTIITLFIIALILQSCGNNENKRFENQGVNAQEYGEGNINYLYLVYGDTVLACKYHSAWFSQPKYEAKTEYTFVNADIEKAKQLNYYKEYTNDKDTFCVTISQKYFSINDPSFYIYDEKGEGIRSKIFRHKTFIDEVPYRTSSESKSEWYLSNSDAIRNWQDSAFEQMDTTIAYLDVMNKICKMSSGYCGKIDTIPQLSLFKDSEFSIQVWKRVMVQELGYEKASWTEVKKIHPFYFDSTRTVDFICPNYHGLETLAKDSNREISLAKYPIILILKKKS
jgi:thioredoxin-related protein